MYTSMLLVALAGSPALANVEEAPVWLTDYGQAKKQGQNEKKPLAVFVAPGKSGWSKLAQDGKLGKSIEQLLAQKYICVHVNSSTTAGQKLAADLQVDGGLGIVISDHSGQLMAFHHEGDLTKQKLKTYLKKFADPERVVETTETNPPPVVRQAVSPPTPTYTPSFGGFGGGRGGC
jgi:hypothetical protein